MHTYAVFCGVEGTPRVGGGSASLVFSTFLGGNGTSPAGTGCPYPDGVYAIALDRSDDIYVTGSACSVDFPTTPGAYQRTDPKPTGDCNTSNAFLAKLNSTGSTLEHSTFLNGPTCFGRAVGYGVSVDSAGNAYVAGFTNDSAFPTLNPLQAPGNGGVFVAEVNKTASQLLFSTTLGYGGTDTGYGIHADNYGNIYVGGITAGTSFPTTTGAVQTTYGGDFDDGFVTRIALTDADLSVTNGAPTTVLTGTHLTYTIVVTNNGPNTAHVVTLTDDLPKGTTFVYATPSRRVTGGMVGPLGVTSITLPARQTCLRRSAPRSSSCRTPAGSDRRGAPARAALTHGPNTQPRSNRAPGP